MEKTKDYAEYLISRINDTLDNIRKMPNCNEILSLSGDRQVEELKDNREIISDIKNLLKNFLTKGEVSLNEGILLFLTIVFLETMMDGLKDDSLTIAYRNDKLYVNAEKRCAAISAIPSIKSVLFEVLRRSDNDVYEAEFAITDNEIAGNIKKNEDKYRFSCKYLANGLLNEVVTNFNGKKLPDAFYIGSIDIYRIIKYFTNIEYSKRYRGLSECISAKSAGKTQIFKPMDTLIEQSIIYDLPSMVVPYDFITQFLFKSMNLDETIKTFFNLLHREASKYLDTSIEEEKKYGV